MILFKRHFFSESDSWIRIITVLVLIISCIVIPFVAFHLGITGPILFLIAVIAPIVLYGVLKYPEFGIAIYLILAYWIMFILNFGVNFPLGTVMDGLLLLMIIGFFMKQKYHPNWEMFRNPISIVIILWILYNFFQAVNPEIASVLAWVYTIRAIAGVTISYFIFSYHIDSIKFVRTIIIVWLVFSFLAAIYAIKQEYWGFFDFEQKALDADTRLQSLLFINGRWRKSSIFADPVSFSYNMVASSILCVVMIFGTTSRRIRILLSVLALLFLNVMLYSGTRAAYVLFPAAMFLFAILKLNKQILIFSICFFMFFVVLVRFPTSNASINRFQSAFRPNNDASYNVRKNNQKIIQPYIQSHPLGGGLGSTGASGVRFSDGTYLSRFPPDSGYVRAAVELGWMGLLLLCSLMFIGLKTGIDNYFEIVDPELKTYCLAMVLILFALAIGNFPQEGIIQFPLNVYFYLIIALMNITLKLDIRKNPRLKNAT